MNDAQRALAWADADAMSWYLLRVEPGREARAQRTLETNDLMATYPTHSITRRKHEKGKATVTVTRPLLAGYVFLVLADPRAAPWFRIAQLHVVQSVVGDSERRPLRVPYADRGSSPGLWRLFAPEHFLKAKRPTQPFYANERVVVTPDGGAFAGCSGLVQELGEHDAVVLLDMFGRQTPARVGLGSLTKAA